MLQPRDSRIATRVIDTVATPVTGPSQAAYSVGMAIAVGHEHIKNARTNVERYNLTRDQVAAELTRALADVFDRDVKSDRVKALLDRRNRTPDEFIADRKKWSDLLQELDESPPASTDDITVDLMAGTREVPEYLIDIPGRNPIRCAGPDFEGVYNSVVPQHREATHEAALRDVERIHRGSDRLLAVYGLVGFNSRFSHSGGYGAKERNEEHEQTLAALAESARATGGAAAGSPLSAFASHPPREPAANANDAESERDGDEDADG